LEKEIKIDQMCGKANRIEPAFLLFGDGWAGRVG